MRKRKKIKIIRRNLVNFWATEPFIEEVPVSPSESAQLPYVLGILLDLIVAESGEIVEQSNKCNDLLIINYDFEGEEKIKNKRIKFIPLWEWLLK